MKDQRPHMIAESLRSGIAAYSDQQQHLLEFLSDWKSQDEFDAHANELGGVHMYGGKVRPYTLGAFILGTWISQGPRNEWLDLLQFMIKLDLITVRKDRFGDVWYRARVDSKKGDGPARTVDRF